MPLTSVDFPNENSNDAPSFNNAKSWKNIPLLAVITGKNGSGKTQLLKYCSKKHWENKTIYFNAEENFESNFRINYDFQTAEEYEGSVDRINYYLKLFCKDFDKFELYLEQIDRTLDGDIVLEIINNHNAKNLKKIIRNDQKYIRNIIENKIKEKSISFNTNIKNPLDLLTNIFGEYLNYPKRVLKECYNIGGRLKGLRDEFDNAYKEEFKPGNFFDFIAIEENKAELIEAYLASLFSSREIVENYPKEVSEIIENINTTLTNYGFKFELHKDNIINKFKEVCNFEQAEEIKEIDTNITLKFNDKISGREISGSKLSSGEKFILGILSWHYYFKYGVFNKFKEKEGTFGEHNLIILDEPDRHLDPNIIKTFMQIVQDIFIPNRIQVIMTTHRIDTVMQVRDDNHIFAIEDNKDGTKKITNPHRLNPIFRMATNLSEFTALQHKVFVEADDDARFYEAIYISLKMLCEPKRREQKYSHSNNPDYYMYFKNQNDGANFGMRLLSERYPLSFFSVSATKGGDKGGVTMVRHSIRNNLIAKQPKSLFRDSNNKSIYKPHGIIDWDYGENKKDLKKEKLEKICIDLRRHSLENYLLDPFIFYRSLSLGQIENIPQFVTKLNGINQRIKQSLLNNTYNNIQQLLNKYFEFLKENLKNNINIAKLALEPLEKMEALNKYYNKGGPEINYNSIQKLQKEKVRTINRGTLKKINKIIDEFNNFNKKLKEQLNANELNNTLQKLTDKINEVNNNFVLVSKEVAKNTDLKSEFDELVKVPIVVSSNTVLSINYPRILLKIKGHDLMNSLFNGNFKEREQKAKDLTDKILEGLENQVSKQRQAQQINNNFLPLPADLVEVFSTLNQTVRAEIRSVIKSDSEASPSSTTATISSDSNQNVTSHAAATSSAAVVNSSQSNASAAAASGSGGQVQTGSNQSGTISPGQRINCKGIIKKISTINGDGDCLFNAIITASKDNNIYTRLTNNDFRLTPQAMRNKLAEIIENDDLFNNETFEEYTREEYAESLRYNLWGGHHELQIIADKCRLNIFIKYSENSWETVITPSQSNGENTYPYIYLAYNGRDHYDALVAPETIEQNEYSSNENHDNFQVQTVNSTSGTDVEETGQQNNGEATGTSTSYNQSSTDPNQNNDNTITNTNTVALLGRNLHGTGHGEKFASTPEGQGQHPGPWPVEYYYDDNTNEWAKTDSVTKPDIYNPIGDTITFDNGEE